MQRPAPPPPSRRSTAADCASVTAADEFPCHEMPQGAAGTAPASSRGGVDNLTATGRLLANRRVSQSRTSSVLAGRPGSAIGRPCQSPRVCLLEREPGQFLARCRVPEPHRLIPRSARQTPAVRRPRHAPNLSLVPGEAVRWVPDVASQSRTALWCDALARVAPSGDHDTLKTAFSCPVRQARCVPVAASQSHRTIVRCARQGRTVGRPRHAIDRVLVPGEAGAGSPVAASQRRTVRSDDPLATVPPSGDHDTLKTPAGRAVGTGFPIHVPEPTICVSGRARAAAAAAATLAAQAAAGRHRAGQATSALTCGTSQRIRQILPHWCREVPPGNRRRHPPGGAPRALPPGGSAAPDRAGLAGDVILHRLVAASRPDHRHQVRHVPEPQRHIVRPTSQGPAVGRPRHAPDHILMPGEGTRRPRRRLTDAPLRLYDPLARVPPSGDQVTLKTPFSCPERQARCVPVAASQRRAVLSVDPLARVALSGRPRHAHDPVLVPGEARCVPVATSQRRTASSARHLLASVAPSGDHDTLRTPPRARRGERAASPLPRPRVAPSYSTRWRGSHRRATTPRYDPVFVPVRRAICVPGRGVPEPHRRYPSDPPADGPTVGRPRHAHRPIPRALRGSALRPRMRRPRAAPFYRPTRWPESHRRATTTRIRSHAPPSAAGSSVRFRQSAAPPCPRTQPRFLTHAQREPPLATSGPGPACPRGPDAAARQNSPRSRGITPAAINDSSSSTSPAEESPAPRCLADQGRSQRTRRGQCPRRPRRFKRPPGPDLHQGAPAAPISVTIPAPPAQAIRSLVKHVVAPLIATIKGITIIITIQ